MDKLQKASFRSALKTLDAGPRKIAQARAEYAEADKYMQEHKRTYSEIGQESFYKNARSKRDSIIKGEVDKIRKALETVREYRTFPGEAIDLSSTKLMNAISVMSVVGKKLRPDEQLSIAEQFRGEPAALHFLADLYRQNGLYYADYVDSMAKPISQEALDNMQYAVDSYEQLGKWPEDKIFWTKDAFAEAATRYGFDVADGKDAYVEALKDARAGKSVEEQRILSGAISEILKGQEYLTDAQKAEIFNDATAKAKAVVENAEAREINKQAVTQGLMDVINTVNEAQGNAIEGGAE